MDLPTKFMTNALNRREIAHELVLLGGDPYVYIWEGIWARKNSGRVPEKMEEGSRFLNLIGEVVQK